jgi:hypothetical protein
MIPIYLGYIVYFEMVLLTATHLAPRAVKFEFLQEALGFVLLGALERLMK